MSGLVIDHHHVPYNRPEHWQRIHLSLIYFKLNVGSKILPGVKITALFMSNDRVEIGENEGKCDGSEYGPAKIRLVSTQIGDTMRTLPSHIWFQP